MTKSILFVYDGNNVVAEYEGSTLNKKYLWGEDVSGSMDGAGGIGGLLAVNDTTENYYTMYDGNGNIVQYFDETQTSVAKFEYTPFGKLKSETETVSNPFKFSSEYFDNETNLVYYNYRYYNPEHGKWLKRDPIAEQGGYNLYGFVNNNSINHIDELGQALYAVDGTWTKASDKANTRKFFELSLEKPKYYWRGPKYGATGLDASGIYRGVKKQICKDYCKNKSISINLVGWSRGATIVMEVAEELQDDGCCCKGKKEYPTVNWIGLFDAVDMTSTWGWANNITSNVKNASHVVKSKKQRLFPTSSATAEDSTKTKVNTVTLENSNHNDVGAKSKIALQWMVHQAQAAGVKMKNVKRDYDEEETY